MKATKYIKIIILGLRGWVVTPETAALDEGVAPETAALDEGVAPD